MANEPQPTPPLADMPASSPAAAPTPPLADKPAPPLADKPVDLIVKNEPPLAVSTPKFRRRFLSISHERAHGEIKVYQHSRIFYWWPVWVFGFAFAGMSFFSGYRIVLVPEGTVVREASIEIPTGKKMPTRTDSDTGLQTPVEPAAHAAPYRGLGTLYCGILLMVITFTTMTFRGLLSVFLMISLIFLAIIFSIMGWWDIIFAKLGQLSIYISAGGYFSLAIVMFSMWVVNLFILDRQTYMVITPGKILVKLEFGGGEIAYGSKGMSFHKMRGDFFRHWILGFGSGDLEVHIEGLQRPLELYNVLNANRVVSEIETVVKEQVIIAKAPPKAE